MIILIGHIELHHGEFGIVRAVDALVAKIFADLIDAFKAADDEALQIELISDAQIKRHVERIVMGDEGPRGRAAVEGLQHRRLHLEIALAVQIAAHGGDDARAGDKMSRTSTVDHQVDIALTVAQLGVGKGVEGSFWPSSTRSLTTGIGRRLLVSSSNFCAKMVISPVRVV